MPHPNFAGFAWILVSAMAIASCGGGSGGNTAPEKYEPAHRLNVSQMPADMEVRGDATVAASFTWGFRTSIPTRSQETYTVSSSSEGVVIGTSAGLVSDGSTITTGLTYRCREVGSVVIPITVTIDSSGTQTTVNWRVDCQPESGHALAFLQVPDSVVVDQDADTHASFMWEFTTTEDTSQERYRLTSTPDTVQFARSEGLVSDNATISSDMTYRCTEIGVTTLRITVSIVGSSTQATFDWEVDCRTKQAQVALNVKFYQGPLVGVMEAMLDDHGWDVRPINHLWPGLSRGHTPSISSNRQTIVEVDLHTIHEIHPDIRVRFPDVEGQEPAERISITTERNHAESFTRRAVYTTPQLGQRGANAIEIEIPLTPDLPQLDRGNNRFVVDPSELQNDTLPDLKFLFVPVLWEFGDIWDIHGFVEKELETLHDLMPIGKTTFRIAEEIDLTDLDPLEEEEGGGEGAEQEVEITEERLLFELLILHAERAGFDEFVHGVYQRKVESEILGIAFVGGRVGLSSEGYTGVFAHEIGHNLTLQHPDDSPFALYPDGGIGQEIGWRMSNETRISGVDNSGSYFVNIMRANYSTDIDTHFVTQQYYTRAKRHLITPVVSASLPPIALDNHEIATGKSFVLVGGSSGGQDWTVYHESVVEKTPYPQVPTFEEGHTIRIVHFDSDTELYRTGLTAHGVGCASGSTSAGWSVRLPGYRGSGLAVEILDATDRVVFTHELGTLEM